MVAIVGEENGDSIVAKEKYAPKLLEELGLARAKGTEQTKSQENGDRAGI